MEPPPGAAAKSKALEAVLPSAAAIGCALVAVIVGLPLLSVVTAVLATVADFTWMSMSARLWALNARINHVLVFGAGVAVLLMSIPCLWAAASVAWDGLGEAAPRWPGQPLDRRRRALRLFARGGAMLLGAVLLVAWVWCFGAMLVLFRWIGGLATGAVTAVAISLITAGTKNYVTSSTTRVLTGPLSAMRAGAIAMLLVFCAVGIIYFGLLLIMPEGTLDTISDRAMWPWQSVFDF